MNKEYYDPELEFRQSVINNINIRGDTIENPKRFFRQCITSYYINDNNNVVSNGRVNLLETRQGLPKRL